MDGDPSEQEKRRANDRGDDPKGVWHALGEDERDWDRGSEDMGAPWVIYDEKIEEKISPIADEEIAQTVEYEEVLKLAKERTNRDQLARVLDDIWNRLRGTQFLELSTPEGSPTTMARSESTDNAYVKKAALEGRINALLSVTQVKGRKRNEYFRIKRGKTSLLAIDPNKKKRPDKKYPDVIFGITTKFPQGDVSVLMLEDKRISTRIDFPEEPFQDKFPSYISGFLPIDNLTDEEIIIARHAVEVGSFNLFGDPNGPSYPWDNT